MKTRRWSHRLAWFVGLWAASVLLTVCVAQLLRWLFARILA
ncbi:MAG TPA: hypothetical protein VNZ06_03250 [Steroidobacteraceae bacterium]|nr:hypothetical protein [Steroidobacteraceae bacterium]